MDTGRQFSIFNVSKEENCQPGILFLAKLSFKVEGENKTFANKQKLRDFVASRPTL